MAKKKQALSPEERLAAALVPEKEWPYALPDGWKWVYLGEITTIVGGGTPSSRCPEYYDDGKIPWITPADLSDYNEVYISHGRRNITQLGLEKSSAKLMPENTVLLSSRAPIGYVAIAANDICTNQGFKSFLPSIHFIPEYLYWFLKGNQALLQQYASGTTFLELSSRRASEIKLPIPPLSEQHRLVARIESLFAKLDAAKEKVQSVLDSHETRKAALLHDAFTGKLTAKWREEQGITFESWHSDTLKNLCEKITDGTHHSPPNAETGDYMYITAKNIKEAGIELDNVTYVTTAVHKEIYSRCDVQKGDVLYIKDGATTGIATVNTLDEPFSLLSSVAVLRPHKDLLLSSYLKHLLNSAEQRSKMIRNMSGNAITRLTLSKIKATSIKVCSLPEQQEIVRILDRLLDKEQRAQQAAEATLAAIDRMKQSILARAFRGEL